MTTIVITIHLDHLFLKHFRINKYKVSSIMCRVVMESMKMIMACIRNYYLPIHATLEKIQILERRVDFV